MNPKKSWGYPRAVKVAQPLVNDSSNPSGYDVTSATISATEMLIFASN
jgi:hypothetical protein